MLRTFRNHIQSWLLKGVLLLVAITFIGFYGYNYVDQSRGEHEVVLEVYDKPITYGELQTAIRNMKDFYRKTFKGSPLEELVENQNYKEMAKNDLIKTKILLHVAEKEQLYVTNQELAEYIQRLPIFLTNGRFDKRKYDFLLSRNRITSKDYEAFERRNLLVKKMENLVKDNVKLSQAEIFDAFKKQNEEIEAEYVLIKPSLFQKKVKIEKKDIEEFYQKNKDDFREPEKRKITYVTITPQDFQKKVTVDENAVQQYYADHKEEYDVPMKIRTRHILIRIPSNATEEKKEEARKKAEAVLERINKGKDFSAMARKYSEDASANTGGDTGYFSKGQRIEEYEKAAFALKKGQVSRPVLTPFGYYIVKVEDIKEAYLKELKDVKPEIETKLKNRKADLLAEDKANEVLEEVLRTNAPLEKVAKKHLLSVKTTGFFSQDAKEAAVPPEIAKTAFSLEMVDDISDILRIDKHFYVVSLADIKKTQVPPLDKIKPRVIKALKNAQIKLAAFHKGKEVLEELKKKKKNLKKAAWEMRIKPKTTEYFSRTSGIPELDINAKSINDIFLLKKGEYTIAQSPAGTYLIRLKARKELDTKGFEAVRESLAEKLLAEKKELVFTSWVQSEINTAYQKGAIVQTNKELLN